MKASRCGKSEARRSSRRKAGSKEREEKKKKTMSCCTYHTTSTECFSLGNRSAHILLVALAISDICFSLAIHPMLVVTSFGIPSEQLFGKTG